MFSFTRQAESLRLLYVLENYWPHVGGVENGFRALCAGMAARGHEVRIVTRRLPGTEARESVDGVDVERIDAPNRYAFTFAAARHVARAARTADVVHTTTFNAAPPAWIGARIARVPVVLTVNETWIGRWGAYTNFGLVKAMLHDALERLVFLPTYDAYCAISDATAARLRDVIPDRRDRISTTYYGFDPQPWRAHAEPRRAIANLGYGADDFIVIGYGRPGASKGFEYLVDAWPAIARAIPNASLLLVLSEGAQYRRERDALERRASPGIRILPSQPFETLTALVAGSDCAVVPSIVEGFGYTTLEACAAGIPVVASDTTSIPEVIGGRFRLVPPRDADAIARGVVDVHAGRYARGPLRDFPFATMLDAYEATYRRLSRAAESELRRVPHAMQRTGANR